MLSSENEFSMLSMEFSRLKVNYIRAMTCKDMPSGVHGKGMPRSACASMQLDRGLHYLLTELDTTEYIHE